MRVRQLLLRLLMSTVAAIGVAIVVVLALTIVDLYLVGHGHSSINREVLAWRSGGVSLSVAVTILLVSVFGAWCAAWLLLRRAA